MMTVTTDSLRNDLAENSRALADARADMALFERISNAAREVARLQKEGDRLTRMMNEAQDREDKAARNAVASRVRDVSISVSYPSGREGVVPRAELAIHWTGLAWNSSSHASEWREFDTVGFDHLPPDVITYLVYVKPTVIPAIIRELVPDNPAAAIERFIFLKRRGYTS